MVFSSFLFLFVFLPVTLLGYFLLPQKARNAWLLAVSLLFYAWGEPIYVLLMAATALLDYLSGLGIHSLQKKGRKKAALSLLAVTTALNLGSLGFFKYTDFFLGIWNDLSGRDLPLLALALPIGISFYTFQTLSYVIDVYRGSVKIQRNFIDFFMYVTLFPQLIAGPIVRYADVEKELHCRSHSPELFSKGIIRFCVGLGKKVLLANACGRFYEELLAGDASVLGAWLTALFFAFQIYFDFSGYSDMAIGLGWLFGFRFPENFRYPYEADSITEFWRRWHITLSSWFREYLYIPLGGNRKGKGRQILNLLIVWALTGFWHGAGWNFILWGLYFFLLLMLEKLLLLRILSKIPAVFRHLYALFGILFGWVLFSCTELSTLASMISRMFGAADALASPLSLFTLLSGAVLLVICALASTHYPSAMLVHCKAKLGALPGFLLSALPALILLLLSIAFLATDSYNPFLYFRF